MLKTFRGLILGLVVLVGSAYVSPTYASSAYIKIVEVQPGGIDSPLDEMVVLYNMSPSPVDLTNWCLTNKSDVEFVCLGKDGPYTQLFLPEYSFAVIVSDSLAQQMSAGSYAARYIPANNSWGSIVASSDTISLVNEVGELVDNHTWMESIGSQYIWRRDRFGIPPTWYYQDADIINDWNVVLRDQIDINGAVLLGEPYPEDPDPEEPYVPPVYLRLSEILPNPKGSDAGLEYIELYNSGADAIDLGNYQLLIGKDLEKIVSLPDEQLEPGGYRFYTHLDFTFTLLNTNSRVALQYNSMVVDEVNYLDPKDDMAWANITGVWQYTNLPTPGTENTPSKVTDETKTETPVAETPSLKPCAPNQYRNPETNRCRLISTSSTSSSSLTPCREGQERNPDTNRCRSVSTKTTELAPCKEGQERNPETNRCRNIVSMTDAPHEVKGVQEVAQQQSSWYVWVVVGLVVSGALAYAGWEWRVEVHQFIVKLKARLFRVKK